MILGAELYTRNIADFQRIPGLVLVNPIPEDVPK